MARQVERIVIYKLIRGVKMEKEERKKLEENVERAVYESMSDASHWAKRRQRWDEWGSPVGLSLGWALFVIPLGIFLWLLHLAGII